MVRAAERNAVAVRIAAIRQRAEVMSLNTVEWRRTATDSAAPASESEYPLAADRSPLARVR